MGANEKHEILPNHLSLLENLSKLIGIHPTAARIEENLSGAPVLGEQIEARRHNLALCAVAIACSPLHKFGRDRVRMRVARLTDEVNVDFQSNALTVIEEPPASLLLYTEGPS